MDKFFIQDIVALKADRSIRAIVCSTWRDTEAVDRQLDTGECIYHNEINTNVFQETISKGRPPDGYVMIEFPAPRWGRTVVSERSLVLLDRAIFVGDVFKRGIHAIESGTVTKTRIQCKVQPIYSDLPYQGSESWHHRAEENEFWALSEELRFDDFQPSDYVAYKHWIGEVLNVQQEVTVVLSNRTVVTVRDPTELLTPVWNTSVNSQLTRRSHMSKSLVDSLQDVREILENTTDTHDMQLPYSHHVGMKVYTKKSNLRLGHWVKGSYSPSISPQGVVIETRVVGLTVDWLTTNIFDEEAVSSPRPSEILTSRDLTSVRLCSTQLSKSPYGSRIAREMMVGDLCRLEYEPEAAMKYSGGAPGGDFRRIPRTITQGYNMNVFNVVESRTEAEVEWQDGSRTWQSSNSLVPHPTVDDHDLWPGEVVSVKDAQSQQDGLLRSTRLGIVQSVDAEDRIAEIRWFKQPLVECFIDEPDQILPGSRCGELSNEVTSASLYELSAFYALSRRRGDIVMVRPLVEDSADLSDSFDFISHLRSRLFDRNENGINGPAPPVGEEFLWVGEVVNVSCDGKVTVRLGAVQPPRDVEVLVDEVHLLLSPDGDDDHEGSLEDDEMEDVSEYTDEDMDSVNAIEETIEYEGGTRLDDGESDAWMTDNSESDVGNEGSDYQSARGGDSSPSSAEDLTSLANDRSESKPATAEARDPDLPESDPDVQEPQAEYRFNEYESMPPQFLILDEEPPNDHHFKSHAHSWSNSGMLRRIRKEHKLLQSSLPRGIWVRTWADRLDLLRVFIVGPQGTPYALAPFVIDFAFGNGYPKGPPEAYFHSWTSNLGKINPNLYEDGTVCLSILGTWPESNDNEAWNPEHSSMLQVVVSLLGLVLVERPYYNEAGFEDMAGKDESLVGERIYSERALVMAKGFVVYGLTHIVPGVDDIIRWVYTDQRGPQLLEWVVRDARALRNSGTRDKQDDQDAEKAQEQRQQTASERPRLSRGALMLLERYLPTLEEMVR